MWPIDVSAGGTLESISGPKWVARILTNYVFVDRSVRSQDILLRNSRTATGGIALLDLDDGVDEFFVGTLPSGLTPALG